MSRTNSLRALAAFVLVCAAAFLCTFASPAAAGLGVSAPVLGDALIGPAAGDQYGVVVARGDDVFLAVWVDERTLVPGEETIEYPSCQDIYAIRLDASGTPLDEVPLVLCDDIGDQRDPSVTWNGTNWLVTWENLSPYGNYRRIEAIRVSPSGTVLDAAPLEVNVNAIGSTDFVAAGSDGTDWIVLIKDTYQSGINTETVLRGAKLSAAGTQVGSPASLFHPTCCYFFSQGSVAYADGTYLLVMECIPDIYAHSGICGLRISQSLENLDGYPFEIALTDDVFKTPEVASNGTGYFVGWDRYVAYPPTITDPYGARVTTSGVSPDHPGGIELWGGVGSGASRSPRVTWDGTNWVAAWTDDAGARIARVSTDGVVLDPGGTSIPGMRVDDIVDAGGGVRIAWSDDSAGGETPDDVRTAFVSSAMVPGPASTVSLGAPSHLFVGVAVGATDTMLVFRSDISGSQRIMVQSTAAYAGRGRAEPVMLDSGQTLSAPEVAWNGSVYLVVWSDEGADEILAVRMMGDGTVLDDPPVLVMSGREPDVAALGDDFLVVGTDEIGSPTVRRAYGARVSGVDGTVLDASPVTLGQSYVRAPRVASLISRWIVSWERRPAHDSESADVWAAFVDADGTTPGEFGVATNQATSEAHLAPAIAAAPGVALIVWEESRLSHGEDWNVYGRRVRIDGVLYEGADGFEVVTDPRDQRHAAVCWNGSVFQVAYETTEQVEWFHHTLPDVYGTRVDDEGVVLDPQTFVVGEGPRSHARPAVDGAGGGSLVVASVFESEPPFASFRLESRSLEDGLTGVPDEPPADGSRVAKLAGASPNPASRSSDVHFVLYEPLHVVVELYDVNGRRVCTLLSETLPAGEHSAAWDGRDGSGREAASGVYFYRMTAGSYEGSGKLAFLR